MRAGLTDYYQLLGLSRNASVEQIRKAYLTYAAKFHPDKHEGDAFFEERFKEVKEAYEILSDEEKRIRYDIKKFGRTRVSGKRETFDPPEETSMPAKKLRIDISHLDIYLALIYLINLAAWVVIRRVQTHGSSGGHIASLFLTGVSTMLMWLFFTGLSDLINRRYTGRMIFLFVYLLLAVLAACIPLWTDWIV